MSSPETEIVYEFNEAHPPLMKNSNHFPKDRSDYLLVGELVIKGADMNRVSDPKYPWKDYLDSTEPPYRQKVKHIHARLTSEVEYYKLARRRCWKMVDRYQYPVDTEKTVTTHKGRTEHRTHSVDDTHTTVTRIAADLNLDLSPGGAGLPPGVEVPPVPMAVGGGPGNGSSTGLHFSREVTDTLHITDVDDKTFVDEKTETTRQTFKGGVTYIYWQIQEECFIWRKLKTEPSPDEEPANVLRVNGAEYTQAFDVT